MVDKKTVGISSLISLGIISLVLIIPGFFTETKYYCEAESSIISCPGGLSGGSMTRCYLNTQQDSWDYCKSGWVEVTDDRPIQEDNNVIIDNRIDYCERQVCKTVDGESVCNCI